jgi:hypothetical protein
VEFQRCGAALERGDAAFALLGFVALLALVDEGFTRCWLFAIGGR